MNPRRLSHVRVPQGCVVALLAVIWILVPLLTACGGPEPTPLVVVVTATFTPEPVVVVITATDTLTPEVAPTSPPSSPLPTETQAPPSPLPTETMVPPPPSNTPVAGKPLGPKATTPAERPATLQPTNTDTPVPPPAAATPVPPTAAATPTAKPAMQPTSLKSYLVVYTAFKGPDLQDYSLWAMNGDGSDVFKIEGAGQASEPELSADGRKLAFYHWTDGLYIWDLDKETSFHVVYEGNASFPSWSPNGQRLAYFVQAGQRWIYVVNADGSDNHQLTPGLRPSWSRQGGFIAYDTCENNQCGIFRINPDGGGKRQLTSDAGGGPTVSPDGKRIAYWSRADGDFEVYLVNADGSGKRQLTQNGGNDALPAWSPDGKYIYYLSDQNGKSWAVMAMNADGSNPRKIVNTSAGSDPGRGWQYQRITVTWNK